MVVAGTVAVGLVVRHRQLRAGAAPAELAATLPGDDLLPHADLVATRAITIDAAPASVWPWIVQIGQGRGGFYSYDALENLVGCDIHSATTIVPALQSLTVGDAVRLHPDLALEVAGVDPPHHLVLRSPAAGPGSTGPPYDFTWAFTLQPAAGATRLVVRERYRYRGRGARLVAEPVSLVSFVMTRRMLHGIRDRAERGA